VKGHSDRVTDPLSPARHNPSNQIINTTVTNSCSTALVVDHRNESAILQVNMYKVLIKA